MLELPEKKLLRPDEVATYFSVSRSTIYLWVEHGQLEAAKLTDGVLRVTLDSVKAFEQRGMMRAAQSSF